MLLITVIKNIFIGDDTIFFGSKFALFLFNRKRCTCKVPEMLVRLIKQVYAIIDPKKDILINT